MYREQGDFKLIQIWNLFFIIATMDFWIFLQWTEYSTRVYMFLIINIVLFSAMELVIINTDLQKEVLYYLIKIVCQVNLN